MAVSLSGALALLIYVSRTAPIRDSRAAFHKPALLETNQRCSIESRHDPSSLPTNSGNLSQSPRNANPPLQASRREISGAEALPGSSFIDFDRWTEKYFAESSDEARLVLESEGDSLAQARRRDLARVIESDPERAIRLAVPVNLRHRLPPSISRHLEERVSARAKYEVIGVLGIPEDPLPRTTIERRVTFKDKTYRAFVYGRRLQQTTKESIPIHGIAVGDALAVHESAVRALEPGESPDPSLAVGNRDGHCPVSKQAADSAVAVESGGEIFYLCRAGHIAAFSQALEEEAMLVGIDQDLVLAKGIPR